jgi:hypothetical protein
LGGVTGEGGSEMLGQIFELHGGDFIGQGNRG